MLHVLLPTSHQIFVIHVMNPTLPSIDALLLDATALIIYQSIQNAHL